MNPLIYFGLSPPNGINCEANEESQRWQQHIIEIADKRRQTDQTDEDNKYRGETAQSGNRRPDQSRAQKSPVVHRLIA